MKRSTVVPNHWYLRISRRLLTRSVHLNEFQFQSSKWGPDFILDFKRGSSSFSLGENEARSTVRVSRLERLPNVVCWLVRRPDSNFGHKGSQGICWGDHLVAKSCEASSVWRVLDTNEWGLVRVRTSEKRDHLAILDTTEPTQILVATPGIQLKGLYGHSD